MTTEIFDISFDGQGVGKKDDKIVFIPDTIIGDVVEFEIVKEKKNFIFGKVVSFIEKSAHRIEVQCPFFESCGGCDFLYLEEYREQIVKESIISNILKKHFDISKAEFIPTDNDYDFYKYRNKIVFQCAIEDEELKFGFYKKGSNSLIKISSCKLFDDVFINVGKKLVNILNDSFELFELKLIKHIVLKKNSDNDVLLGVVLKEKNKKVLDKLKEIKIEEVSTFVVNINTKKTSQNFGDDTIVLYGTGYIKERLFNYVFDISLLSFFQVNKEQSIKLYELIYEFLKHENVDCIIDGYAGVGTIAFSLSKYFNKVIGVEVIEQAYESALKAKEKNNVENIDFVLGKFEDKVQDILKENKNSALVLDPPRRGCDQNVINSVIENNIETVIYVSCDISGFVKDMKILQEYYDIERYSVVNMFPRTKSIESVIALKRKSDI